MPTPTHEEISLLAHKLWQDRGSPGGIDLETWLEAEKQLLEGTPAEPPADRAKAEPAAGNVIEHHLPHVMPQEDAGKAALMKHDARAPQLPHHTGPKSQPAPTGKPVWQKPHSS